MIRIASLLLIFAIASAAEAKAAPPGEYEVKAAFIHNIAKFIEWPARTNDKLRLCIVGNDPFGNAVDMLRGKKAGDLIWEVREVDRAGDLKACQVLFIATSEQGNIGVIRQRIEGGAVLTVGDTPGYAEQGVMVNFYLEQDKVRFEINHAAAKLAGLRIGSQLLRLGKVVAGQEGDR